MPERHPYFYKNTGTRPLFSQYIRFTQYKLFHRKRNISGSMRQHWGGKKKYSKAFPVG